VANFDFKIWRAGTVGCPPADRLLALWRAVADRARAPTPRGDHAPATASRGVSPFWERQRARSLPLAHFALSSLSLSLSLSPRTRQSSSSGSGSAPAPPHRPPPRSVIATAPFTDFSRHEHRRLMRHAADPRATLIV